MKPCAINAVLQTPCSPFSSKTVKLCVYLLTGFSVILGPIFAQTKTAKPGAPPALSPIHIDPVHEGDTTITGISPMPKVAVTARLNGSSGVSSANPNNDGCFAMVLGGPAHTGNLVEVSGSARGDLPSMVSRPSLLPAPPRHRALPMPAKCRVMVNRRPPLRLLGPRPARLACPNQASPRCTMVIHQSRSRRIPPTLRSQVWGFMLRFRRPHPIPALSLGRATAIPTPSPALAALRRILNLFKADRQSRHRSLPFPMALSANTGRIRAAWFQPHRVCPLRVVTPRREPRRSA